MICRSLFAVWGLLALSISPSWAQFGEVPINTFGYFQAAFNHQDTRENIDNANSFSVQQLNLIFQSDLSRRWRAFVDFEMLNNFSSSRRWGSFDLNEAWISYRANARLSVKAGLHVPVFNRLNDIKNRTPLLPYVIRPLVYEESFGEFIAVEDFVPERAFAQVKGFVPVGQAKLDYAAYLGNSPNIRSQFDNIREGLTEQTGIDTTTTVLVGGRLGLRYGELELGGSATHEVENLFTGLETVLDIPDESLSGTPKTRLGADLAFHLGRFSFEGEFITVHHAVDPPPALQPLPSGRRADIDLDRTFYYGTLGYEVNERLFAYGSYWFADQVFRLQSRDRDDLEDVDIEVPTVGIRYTLLQDDIGFDRVTLKAQYAYALVDFHVQFLNVLNEDDVSVLIDQVSGKQRLNFFALAVSVLF